MERSLNALVLATFALLLAIGSRSAAAQIIDPAQRGKKRLNTTVVSESSPVIRTESQLDQVSPTVPPFAVSGEPTPARTVGLVARSQLPIDRPPRVHSALTAPVENYSSPPESNYPHRPTTESAESAGVAETAASYANPRPTEFGVESGNELMTTTQATGPESTDSRPALATNWQALKSWKDWTQPTRVESTLKTMAFLTVISLAPAILLMTTSFVRISVVLSLLRQALGTQMLPSNQMVTSLSMFLSLLVMMPIWKQVYDQAIVPYTEDGSTMTSSEAWQAGIGPVRTFMGNQIHWAGNTEDVLLFYEYLPDSAQPPQYYDDVPLHVLLPAFMVSELKTAFLIGFRIFIPFLILDLVVSSVTVSMGMMMLPPATISLPLKLLLFVLVDGWHLIVGMLLQSFGGG